MTAIRTHSGFSLVELLAAIGIGGLLLAGALGLFSAHTRGYTREDLSVVLQDNLRLSMDVVVSSLRAAGDGVPEKQLASWLPWFGGFTTRPVVVSSDGTTLSVAGCTSQPVARLTSLVAANATTMQLASAVAGSTLGDELDTDHKRFIVIDDDEPAHITMITGGAVSLDTDPLTVGNQGLRRSYPVGTPICRVDVLTYQVVANSVTGQPELQVDDHHGGAARIVAEGISALAVTTITDGHVYQIGLTAQAPMRDPLSGSLLSGGLRTDVSLRN
jgi:prepilin-type N-terminal cleavage/methylation domain-containing protein